MALLCTKHHDALDKHGRITPAQVMLHRAQPMAKQQGFTRDDTLYFKMDNFILTIGSTTFTDCGSVLCIDGVDVLRIDRSDVPDGPYRVSSLFCDSDGTLIATIVKNEILSRASMWDVEVVGPRITFRESKGRICLVLRTTPGEGLRIERMDMCWAGVRLVANDDEVILASSGSSTGLGLPACVFQATGISVNKGVVSVGGVFSIPLDVDVQFIGGKFSS